GRRAVFEHPDYLIPREDVRIRLTRRAGHLAGRVELPYDQLAPFLPFRLPGEPQRRTTQAQRDHPAHTPSLEESGSTAVPTDKCRLDPGNRPGQMVATVQEGNRRWATNATDPPGDGSAKRLRRAAAR